ncbi:pentatricopeptide repeat-containing protein At1g53600, mitochondrial-like [Aristolochia californica]|uniref:pentatricopeptide repeat-containing protein At1g53600, mitochondrial-like n=1 Tax=Aristolochia californica TaxID=171875 RepID=UPI0035DE83B4
MGHKNFLPSSFNFPLLAVYAKRKPLTLALHSKQETDLIEFCGYSHKLEHYVLFVDILASAGDLEGVLALVSEIRDGDILGHMYSACGDVVSARTMFVEIFRLGGGSGNSIVDDYEMCGDVFVGTSLMHMYSKFGDIPGAYQTIDEMQFRDVGTWHTMIVGFCQKYVISWSTILTGFARNRLADDAIKHFHVLGKSDGILVDQGTNISLLSALSHVGSMQQGMVIPGRTIRTGLLYEMFDHGPKISTGMECSHPWSCKLEDPRAVVYAKQRDATLEELGLTEVIMN